MTTFMDLYMAGKAAPDDIDDHVERWHCGQGEESLAEFLGFTDAEYAVWAARPSELPRLTEDRRTRSSVAAE